MSRVRGFLTPSGEWQCDCTPRLPAVWLEVKKNNQNKGRHFYTCQKPQEERCRFFLWDTDADAREKAQFGETLAEKHGVVAPAANASPRAAEDTTAAGGKVIVPAVRVRSPASIAAPITRNLPPPSKQTAFAKIYPFLPDDDDGFDYLDTPTKHPGGLRRKSVEEEEPFAWEESDEEIPRKKLALTDFPPPKRPRFDVALETMQELEYSPPASPVTRTKPPKGLADPFITPPKQVTATPHTPPETRPLKSAGSANLLSISYALLHQLDGYQEELGSSLWTALRDHLLRCGRVADGAVKGRDSARAAITEKDNLIEDLDKRIRILEAEREVDRAVIGALKRNVDVLTGKVKRTDY